MKPLTIEIVTYAPTEFFHCSHCEIVWQEVGVGQKIHREQREAAIPPDLQQEFERLSRWVSDLVATHPDRLRINVIDAASLEGFLKTVRHGLRRYPAFLVNGHQLDVGGDPDRARAIIDEKLLQAEPAASP